MNSLLRCAVPLNPPDTKQRKKGEENALATAPCAEIANEVVQGLGWLQVAKCTQGDIFDSIDEALARIRHDGITRSEQSPFKRTSGVSRCAIIGTLHDPAAGVGTENRRRG